MKTFRKAFIGALAVVAGFSLAACGDANEYEDANTANPSWVDNYTEDTEVTHPEDLTGTTWVRGTGIKTNAYGEDIQGFVESLDFVSETEVAVVMSQGATEGTWVDDSNTEDLPYYEYTYSSTTGNLAILKEVKDDKGNLTKNSIFVGVAVSGTQEGITVVHYGDTPVQTYLVKK